MRTPSRPTMGSTRTDADVSLRESVLDLLQAAAVGEAADVAVEVGGEGGSELFAGGDGERSQGHAVVGGLEGDHSRPAGGAQGGLEGDLDGLGAGDGEEDLRVVDRGDLHQAAGELHPQGMGVDVPKPMEEAAGLLTDGCHDPRMAVPDGGDAEAGGEVYIDIAVDVPDVGALGFFPKDGGIAAEEGVDAGGLQIAQGLGQLAGARPGRRGEDLGKEIAKGIAEAHISRRPASERPSVTSSVYSMSPPTGMPKARRVTRTPRGLSSRAR